MNDDAELIAQTLSGQSAAFGELVRRYQDRLYTTLTHVTGSPEDARDLVQDAFVQAFVKLESFQRQSAFYTWLYRIAFNLAMTGRRRRRPTVSVEANRETTGDEPLAPGPAPGDRLEQQERVRQVQLALGALSEEHRAVLVLRELEGHDYESVAQILEIPLNTVRSRLHRARMQLREHLKELVQEDLT